MTTDRRYKATILRRFEAVFAEALIQYLPSWVQSHHLTLITLVWTGVAFTVGILASRDRRWLWALSVLIVLQYATDAIDGKVGKLRGDGLIRWGYYMDHFLDYAFLCALLFFTAPSCHRHRTT